MPNAFASFLSSAVSVLHASAWNESSVNLDGIEDTLNKFKETKNSSNY